jgi:uncharacterized protein
LSPNRRATLRRGLLAAAALLAPVLSPGAPALAREPLPPAPARWVSDRAGVLSPDAATRLDRRLEAFELEQGSQVLVATFRRLPEDEALEDWTQRVAESWRVGRARQDDGAVLFVFVEDRLLRLEVGYGLEGALTDLESKVILEEVLVPRLREGDWDGGLEAAAEAILAAIRGEYRPDPGASPRERRVTAGLPAIVVFIVLVILVNLIARRARGMGVGGPKGPGGWGGGGWGGFGGGGFSGGGFSGGGFSGGGGSFGGGGASGRW